ncbi:MAG: MlaE family ABC transporter permease [Gammaproteobacteria bacterium]
MKKITSQIGQRSIASIEELGYAFMLLLESMQWLLLGKFQQQPVRLRHIFAEAMRIGVQAIPIVAVLCYAVGTMLAIQGLESLKPYGAQSEVVTGVALSITREFSSLIIAILVAGRSGSAITARIGTMQDSQEIDALRVIGINPIRYLAAPILVAMMIMMPGLTILGDLFGILGSAVYTSIELQISITAYFERSFEILEAYDVFQGLIKSVVFSVIIVVVGVSNGFQVKDGAEGVGRATTRSVVQAISFIVIADMIFTFFLTR